MASAVIRPVSGIRNREHKRKFAEDAKKILPMLMEIDDNFLKDLFDPETSDDYLHIYLFYKAKWNAVCEHARAYYPYVEVNATYFEKMYKPQL